MRSHLVLSQLNNMELFQLPLFLLLDSNNVIYQVSVPNIKTIAVYFKYRNLESQSVTNMKGKIT